MQIFVSDMGYVYVAAMRTVNEFPKVLKMFAKEVGVNEAITADSQKRNKSKKVKLFCHKIGTTLRILECSTKWANKAELYVRLFKEAARKEMLDENYLLVLWDYFAERRSLITNMTEKYLIQLQGQTPYFATFGEEGDISNKCQFGSFEWVYFRETTGKFSFPSYVRGRCLGPAKNELNEMAQWVLKQNGKIVPRRTMRKLAQDELIRESETKKRDGFDAATKILYVYSFSLPTKTRVKGRSQEADDAFDLPFDEISPEIPETDTVDAQGKPLHPPSEADIMMNADVLLPQGEDVQLVKFIRRNVDSNGQVLGDYKKITMLNTIIYDVQFPDGAIKPYSADLIAENILTQVDADGHHNQLLE